MYTIIPTRFSNKIGRDIRSTPSSSLSHQNYASMELIAAHSNQSTYGFVISAIRKYIHIYQSPLAGCEYINYLVFRYPLLVY